MAPPWGSLQPMAKHGQQILGPSPLVGKTSNVRNVHGSSTFGCCLQWVSQAGPSLWCRMWNSELGNKTWSSILTSWGKALGQIYSTLVERCLANCFLFEAYSRVHAPYPDQERAESLMMPQASDPSAG